MPITKQRILQAGVVTLAMTMLGGYVVYSQRAQQPQQVAPTSKGGIFRSGPIESPNNVGTNLFNVTLSLDANRQASSSNGLVRAMAWTNTSRLMMSGSKFGTVVPEDVVLWTPAPTSPTNPASRVMMPSSKLIVLSRPAGASISTVANTNAVSQPAPAK